jgi:DNA-binding Xre family transcriptional regulator
LDDTATAENSRIQKIYMDYLKLSWVKMQEKFMEKFMLPLDCVSRIKWDEVAGENLRVARGKASRQALADMVNNQLKNIDPPFSQSYIQKLENNTLESVPVETLQAICTCLNISMGKLIDVYRYM